MSEIKHDMSMKASCDTLYKALTTEEGLRAWFTSQANGSGKVGTNWELQFTDQPAFTWNILADEEPHRVVWKCLNGPGNSPGTEVEFILKSISENETKLTIIHRGWTKADPKFERCVEIWRKLMDHMQRYCETGFDEPAYH